MKILYILKNDLDETATKIMEIHKESNEVTIVRLEEKSAEELLDLIEATDKLIMW